MMPDRLNGIKLLVVTLRNEAHHDHDLGHRHIVDLFFVIDTVLLIYFLKIPFKFI